MLQWLVIGYLALTWDEWPKVSASHPMSMQVRRGPGQIQSRVDPSSQPASQYFPFGQGFKAMDDTAD